MTVKETENNGRFRKGDPRPQGAGRKPGSINKTTRTVKQAIEGAFENVGGVEWLENLARTDPRTFAVLLAKLVPSDVRFEQPPVFKLVNAVYPLDEQES